MVEMLEPAWKEGFTVTRNLKGWRHEGTIPFTRNALWFVRGEEAASSRSSQSSLSTQQSTGLPAGDAPATDGPESSATPPAVSTMALPKLPEAVEGVLLAIRSRSSSALASAGEPLAGPIVEENLRLSEHSYVRATLLRC